MDIKLSELCDGEHIYDNDGTHLDGDTPDDKIWQDRYKLIIVYPLNLHDLPTGPVGRSFIKTLSDELNGVIERKWNFERPLCFTSSVLQKSPDIKGTPNARKRIKQRLSE